MWELVAKHAAPEKLLIAGTGMESVRETVCLTNRAAEMGYKAAMVRTPHYYKNLVNRADAQTLYYRAVADQSKHPADHLQLAAGHRRRHSGGSGGGDLRASQRDRDQGELGQPGKSDADDPRGEARLSGAGRVGAHAVAVAADGRVRRDSGVRQRRAVFGDRHLGSVPAARRSGGARLAESHRPRVHAGDDRSTACRA